MKSAVILTSLLFLYFVTMPALATVKKGVAGGSLNPASSHNQVEVEVEEEAPDDQLEDEEVDFLESTFPQVVIFIDWLYAMGINEGFIQYVYELVVENPVQALAVDRWLAMNVQMLIQLLWVQWNAVNGCGR